MQTAQWTWREATGWTGARLTRGPASLVLYFGSRAALSDKARYDELREIFPDAHLLGCTAGGQIYQDDVVDDIISAVAVRFDRTTLKLVSEPVKDAAFSRACGMAIGSALISSDLASIFVLSDGLNVNGSALVAGITEIVGHDIPLTGGLAGDGSDFRRTLVGANDAPQANRVAALGFYGSAIRIGHGSAGGWDVFGPRRRITKSEGNVLLELDGEPALDLYERYLGADEAKGLPGTGLVFPLQIFPPERPDTNVVRTILAVDRDRRSMTFAGDMPEGWTAQLMRGNFDHLSAGAANAARQARTGLNGDGGVAILVSCIGRRLLMGQRITDEVEAAGAELGDKTLRLGFYSYGEISPHAATGTCELHNQTMTVTAFHEAAG